MNCKIPFTKDISFLKKVSEITSISLEHEIMPEEGLLKGNFIVSGDFKSHEVSVNKEAFSYVLPFEIELADDVDITTIEFMIDDFTYEVVDNSILRVNIDFNVIAGKKENIEEEKEETIFRDASELFDDDVDIKLSDVIDSEEKEVDVKEELDEKENLEEKIEEKIEENNLEEVVEDREAIDKKMIIDDIKLGDEEYATYHIHMVSDGESVETICTMYNTNINILGEYNNLNDLASGDKLIIPEKDE